MEAGSEKIDDQKQVEVISTLMGLYSQAIEFYHREEDSDNQTYYVDKLSKLNETIREMVERQQRMAARKNKKSSPENPNVIK